MAQFARPDSDVAAGSWTATPLWSKVDEVTASDADLITSDNNTLGDTCELGLGSVSAPDAGTATVRYRHRKNASDGHAIDGRVRLLQGATEIASWTHLGVSDVFATVAQALSQAQRDAITDWANLRVEFQRNGETGGGPSGRRSYQVSWTELEAPDASGAPVTVTPGTASLITAAFAPTVTASAHKTVTPGTVSLTTATFAPAVTTSDHKSVTPGAATLTTATFAPSVTAAANVSVTPGTASLTLATFAPSVTAISGQTAVPGTATLITATFAPTVSTSLNIFVTPSTVGLTLSAFAPTVTVAGAAAVTPGTASLVLATFAPSVTVTGGEPSSERLGQGGMSVQLKTFFGHR